MSKTFSPSAGKSIVKPVNVALFNGAGNKVTVELPRLNVLREVGLYLQVTPTVTLGNNTVANTAKGDAWGCISNVRLVVNNTDTVFEMTGDELYALNREEYGVNPRLNPTLGDGATANPALTGLLRIPMWALRCRKPMETALELWRFGSVRVEITFTSWTGINTAATAYTANPQVTVITSELTPAFDPNGVLKYIPPFTPRIIKQYQDFATAQTAGKFFLDGAPFHRKLIINVQANGGGDDLINTLTNVKLFAGSTLLRDFPGAALQPWGELGKGVASFLEIDSTNIARQTRGRISQSSDPRAWYTLDILEDGWLSEAVGGMNSQDVYLELVTSGACRIVILAFQVEPNPAAPVAAAA